GRREIHRLPIAAVRDVELQAAQNLVAKANLRTVDLPGPPALRLVDEEDVEIAVKQVVQLVEDGNPVRSDDLCDESDPAAHRDVSPRTLPATNDARPAVS